MLRDKFSVVLEKSAREITGTPCLELDEADPLKQEICCSRMFGKRLKEVTPIKQAVVTSTGDGSREAACPGPGMQAHAGIDLRRHVQSQRTALY